METNDQASTTDRANSIPWPPILYVIVLAAAWGLQRLVPLPPLVREPFSSMIGWPLVISGVCVGLAAIVRFRVLGTAIEPTSPASVLATAGIYRLTRNPMYLGAVTALLGLGVLMDWSWLIVLSLGLPLLLWHLAIKREEAYLQRRFGAQYDAYCSRVRRWL